MPSISIMHYELCIMNYALADDEFLRMVDFRAVDFEDINAFGKTCGGEGGVVIQGDLHVVVGDLSDLVDPGLDVDGVRSGLGVVHGQGELINLVLVAAGSGRGLAALGSGSLGSAAGAQTQAKGQCQKQRHQNGHTLFHFVLFPPYY